MTLTLLMIKPDAIRQPVVVSEIERGIRERGLLPVHTARTRLTDDDVRMLFPALHRDLCPFTRSFLSWYLTSDAVRFLALAGPDAIAHGRDLRKQIRSRHATAGFANCIHVAADEQEARLQLNWLAGRDGSRQGWAAALEPPLPSNVIPYIPGITGRLAELEPAELTAMAQRAWDAAVRNGWDSLWTLRPEPDAWRAVLVTDDRNSLDYAASVLHETPAGLDADSALRAVLEVDRVGHATVYAGGQALAAEIAGALTSRGLLAEVQPPVAVDVCHG